MVAVSSTQNSHKLALITLKIVETHTQAQLENFRGPYKGTINQRRVDTMRKGKRTLCE